MVNGADWHGRDARCIIVPSIWPFVPDRGDLRVGCAAWDANRSRNTTSSNAIGGLVDQLDRDTLLARDRSHGRVDEGVAQVLT